MLRGFGGCNLVLGGEGWLIISTITSGLAVARTIAGPDRCGGLCVAGRLDVRPHHPKAADENDPLHVARAK